MRYKLIKEAQERCVWMCFGDANFALPY